MTEIMLVRHAHAQAGPTPHWLGWSDPPLTPTGRAQAQAIAHRLSAERGQIAALYTSPLRRASETAQAIGEALNLLPIPDDRLKEIHFGQLEAVALEEMEAQFPVLYAQWQDKTDMAFQWPEGELRADFFRRAAEACQCILACLPRDPVVVVARGGTIRACLAHLLPHQFGEWWTYSLDNAGLTRLSVAASDTRLHVLNDTDHLPARERR